MKKSELVEEHLKRLVAAGVPWLEYKGAVEGFCAVGFYKYPKALRLLEGYRNTCVGLAPAGADHEEV